MASPIHSAKAIDWAAVIRSICPRAKPPIAAGLVAAMPRVIEIAALSTPLRLAHFLAQVAHESDGLRTTVEYASGAEYEGRNDLGNTQRGDGQRFKGRGLIQLTGRSNYFAYGFELGINLVGHPNLAAQFPAAVLTAALYWRKRAINADADRDDVRAVTKKINGGTNGLASRSSYLSVAKRALAKH
jgi:putative chitinase